MGRAPCCDKANVKKGPWSPEEDAKLKAYIEQNGTGGNWIALPQKIGLKRCGKSCRLRWLNYLRPNIKHGGFSEEEDSIICSLYINIGSRWSIIAAQLPGRTDNDIKNYWNTRLKKKLLGKQRKEQNQGRRQIKRENRSFIAEASMSQQTLVPNYWPELPSSTMVMPVMNPIIQGPDSDLSDQESLKSLLIKLGGRFSDHHQLESNITNTINYPLDGSCSSTTTHQDQPYTNSMAPMLSSSSSTMETTCSQLANNNYAYLPTELDGMVYGNHQQLQGMESLYAVSSGESGSWGNTSPLDYPQLVSEFENCLQSLPQDHNSFEVSSYFGPQ